MAFVESRTSIDSGGAALADVNVPPGASVTAITATDARGEPVAVARRLVDRPDPSDGTRHPDHRPRDGALRAAGRSAVRSSTHITTTVTAPVASVLTPAVQTLEAGHPVLVSFSTPVARAAISANDTHTTSVAHDRRRRPRGDPRRRHVRHRADRGRAARLGDAAGGGPDRLVRRRTPRRRSSARRQGLGTYAGPAAIGSFCEGWIEVYEEFVLTAADLLDLGGGVVLTANRHSGRLRGSSAEVILDNAWVFACGRDAIVRWTVYDEVDEARAAGERLAEKRA